MWGCAEAPSEHCPQPLFPDYIFLENIMEHPISASYNSSSTRVVVWAYAADLSSSTSACIHAEAVELRTDFRSWVPTLRLSLLPLHQRSGTRIQALDSVEEQVPRRVMVTYEEYESSDEEDYKDAAKYAGIVPEDSDNVYTLAAKGRAQYDAGDYSAAKMTFLQADQLEPLAPGRFKHLNNASACMLQLEDYEGAMEYTKRVLEVRFAIAEYRHHQCTHYVRRCSKTPLLLYHIQLVVLQTARSCSR